MNRSLIAYLLLILVPAAVLAVLAFRVADRDHAEGLGRLRSRLEDEANALQQRLESSIADAVRRGRQVLQRTEDELHGAGSPSPGDPVALWTGERFLGYSPPRVSGETVSSDEWKYYRLSLRGGESYEFSRQDAERALDAYAFYLPRIRDPGLRARLRFRTGRAALAAGRAELGKALLREVFENREDRALVLEDGYPVDLLAARRLLEDAGDETGPLRQALRARLRAQSRALATELLEDLVGEFAPDDDELRELVERRKELESSIAAHREILPARDAVLDIDGRYLLLARTVNGQPEVGPPLRAIHRVDVVLPLATEKFEAALVRQAPKSPLDREGEISTLRPLRLAGSTLAFLTVSDPSHGSERRDLDRRRLLFRVLTGVLIVLTLGGGLALVTYHVRERHLARLRAHLLANVSHELKTPITSIRMFSEMLSESSFDANRTRRFGQLLLSESLRLGRIVEHLLDFSRLGRKEGTLAPEPEDLRALLARVVDGFAVRAREAGVAFEGPGSGGGEADGIPNLRVPHGPVVERILVNLLENALKYRRQEAAEIRLDLERAGGRLRISVIDNGIGIPRRDRERIFEEFYRVRYEDYGVQGFGLGLSIARRLARRLEGDITVASREGEGSTFTLELPVTEPPEETLKEAS